MDRLVALDRFVFGIGGRGPGTRILITDLRTGRTGSITPASAPKSSVAYSNPKSTDARLYTTEVGDEHVIVDLAAIG
jgi:hypothetical protein